MYKIVPNQRNNQCAITMNRWELRTKSNEFVGCFARKEVAESVLEALETMNAIAYGPRAYANPSNYFIWYNPDREEKIFSFNGESAAFVWIPPGMFAMGDEETDQQIITFKEGFWMQTTPVTQGQWFAVMGHNPAHFIERGLQCPVENVSWVDVKNFVSQLSSLGNFRLPTEAEWEYACRAGTTTKYHFGDDPDLLQKYAWYNKNAGGTVHPVGQLTPNSWGLYDMHGNVWEWCLNTVVAPVKFGHMNEAKSVRGGSWDSNARGCRSAPRYHNSPDYRNSNVGFRLVFTE